MKMERRRRTAEGIIYYVYLLVSTKVPTKVYIGTTTGLKVRLQELNRKKSGYSKQYAPGN